MTKNSQKVLPCRQEGFTLIELLIGLAMTTVVFLLTTQVVIALLGRTTKGNRVETLEQTANDVQTDLNNAIKWAENVEFVNGVLSVDDITFELVDGTIYKDGVPLTSGDVRVTSFEVFKRAESESSGESGNGIGLMAEYYDHCDFTDLKFGQIDFEVDFNWDKESPHPDMDKDKFSIRWSGQVESVSAGRYKFITESDDGARLWVNGQIIINDSSWDPCKKGHSANTYSGFIDLAENTRYDIVMEYYENTGRALARLLWQRPGGGSEIVPTQYLYPTASRANLEVVIGVEHVEDPSLTDSYRIILTPRSGVVGAVHPAPTPTPPPTPSSPAPAETETPRPTSSPSPSPEPTGEGPRPTLPPTQAPSPPPPTPTPKPPR